MNNLNEILELVKKNSNRIRENEYCGELTHGIIYTIPTEIGEIKYDIVLSEGFFTHKNTSISIKNGIHRNKIYKPFPTQCRKIGTEKEIEMMDFWKELTAICRKSVLESDVNKHETKLQTVWNNLNTLLE